MYSKCSKLKVVYNGHQHQQPVTGEFWRLIFLQIKLCLTVIILLVLFVVVVVSTCSI